MTSRGSSRPLRVLIGGGIGAGKSTVCEMLEDLGFTVISADAIGRAVLVDDEDVVSEVGAMWPDVVVDGEIDRSLLAASVFSDPEALRRLEAISHPRIGRRVALMLRDIPGDAAVEVPIQHLDLGRGLVRIAVVANPDIRLARAVARGGVRADVERRMASQPTNPQWLEWGDVVVDNTGPIAETERQVRAIVAELRTDG